MGVVKTLLIDHRESAISFTKLVLEDAHTVWRRGEYYRQVLASINPGDRECLRKTEDIQQYVVYLTSFVKKIYTDIPDEIQPAYNKLIKTISSNISHQLA